MISSAMNEIILKIFDYASQGLPCLLDNLCQLMACQQLALSDAQEGLEAANDIIQLTETDWEGVTSFGATRGLEQAADDPRCLLLRLETYPQLDVQESCLLVCRFTTSEAARAALHNPDLKSLIPHIQQAVLIARDISEQIGDILALQYVIQHHPLKSLFLDSSANGFLSGEQSHSLPAANQNFALDISKQSLSQHFHLSPSEIELTQALFNGLSLNEITEQRHVSKQTVRKQLQSILKKTGVKSQEELILLLFDTCLLTCLEQDTHHADKSLGHLARHPTGQ